MDDAPTKTLQNGAGNPDPAYNAQIHPSFVEQLYAIGLTETDVAKVFGVPVESLSIWECDYPEFYDACERGRSAATNRIENNLAKLANGYDQLRERPTKIHGELAMMPELRHVPPSVAANRLLLEHRDRSATKKNVSEGNLSAVWTGLKPKTFFDIVAENEAKQNGETSSDD